METASDAAREPEENAMKHYLLGMYQPEGPPPSNLPDIMREVRAINDEMRAAGVWVFSNGLHAASSATVVKSRNGEVFTTDGPYVEGKEHLGGLYVIRAPDLDAALAWARKVVRATTLPIEVRPFQGDA
jgi:hypothetical protein